MDGAIGIDLGGTSIKGVLTDFAGNILGWRQVPTEKEQGVGHVLMQVGTLIKVFSGNGLDIAGVGVGIPGMLDFQREKVLLAPNLGWTNIDLKNSLQQQTGVPVILDNDANAAAMGEAWLGAGKNRGCFLLVTIGTGIGSGLVLEGKVFRGANGLAAELGHMKITEDGPLCSCGQHGCLETLVSSRVIKKQAQESLIVPKTGEAKDVLELANKGNQGAVCVVREAMAHLAVGLKNVVVLLDLDLILIGGGVGDSLGMFINILKDNIIDLLPVKRNIEVRRASLGNRAGSLGAARLAFLESEKKFFYL